MNLRDEIEKILDHLGLELGAVSSRDVDWAVEAILTLIRSAVEEVIEDLRLTLVHPAMDDEYKKSHGIPMQWLEKYLNEQRTKLNKILGE